MFLCSRPPFQSTPNFLLNRHGLCLIAPGPLITPSCFLQPSISQLRLVAGEVLVDGMRGPSVHAWLGDGRMLAHNCFTKIDLVLQRGNLTASYDWWEHGTFSVHAEIAQGKAWAFLPSVSAFHLVAETAHGTLTNDFDNLAVERTASAAAAKIDMLVNGGGQAAIKMRAADGDIKIVEANP